MNPNDSSYPAYEYTSFPRKFTSYRWFKPLLVALLTVVFMTILQIVLTLAASIWSGNPHFLDTISADYEDLSVYDGPGALFGVGAIAAILPALALAALIVRDRPYSSYSSSRGGWNWGAFAKCLGIAVVVFVASTLVSMLVYPSEGESGPIVFTVSGVIICAVLVPFQCLAEEYIFRGLIMQTVGSWVRLPVLAIVVQAVVFAAGHPYNDIGVVAIFLSGIIMGVVAWQTKGLEASGALHIVNNMVAFFATGLGLQAATSEVDIPSLIIAVATDLVFAVIVIILAKKTNCFASKGDGAAAFNEKHRIRMERKQQRRNGQQPLAQQPIRSYGEQMPQPAYPRAAQQVYPQQVYAQPSQPAQQAYPQPLYPQSESAQSQPVQQQAGQTYARQHEAQQFGQLRGGQQQPVQPQAGQQYPVQQQFSFPQYSEQQQFDQQQFVQQRNMPQTGPGPSGQQPIRQQPGQVWQESQWQQSARDDGWPEPPVQR